MAAPTFDRKAFIPQEHPQSDRRVEIPFELDFADTELTDGTGLAADEDIEIGDLPAGYVHERLDAVLRVAEGEAATLDVGSEADPNGFASVLNMNGTINAAIALAGTEAFAAGTYFNVKTPIRATCPAAANVLNVGKVQLTFIGYMRPTA